MWMSMSRRLNLDIDLIPVLLMVAACAGVLALAVHATHGLDLPPEGDAFRDLAIARTVAAGEAGADPAYAGERLWYNPLFPAVIAALAKVTRAPLPVVSVR